MQRRKIVPSLYFSLYIFTIGGSELLKDILIWVHIVSLEYFSLMCLLCISASLLHIDFVFLESSSSFSCHSKHAWFYVSPLNLRTKIRETYNICLFRFLIFKKIIIWEFLYNENMIISTIFSCLLSQPLQYHLLTSCLFIYSYFWELNTFKK